MLRRLRYGDDGAVAVIVAITALLLFGIGALAVDLGNAYSRRREAQTTADLAALAGGQSLPDSCAAFAAAVKYLHDNPVSDDSGAPADFSNVTDEQLADGNLANGEVQVQNGAGLAMPACPTSTAARRIKVVVPGRNVAFGLANALGFSSTDVSASATAGIFSGGSLLPIFIPQPCQSGSQVIKEGSGGTVTPMYDPDGDNSGPTVDVVSPFEGTSGSTPTLTITLSDMANPASSQTVDTLGVMFTRGTTNVPAPADPVLHPATFVPDPVSSREGTVTVPLPAAVANVSGVWSVRVGQTVSGALHWSPNSKVGHYQVTPASCGQQATGDFGLLSSPRRTTVNNPTQGDLEQNLADGIDHLVAEFPTQPPPVDPSVADNCRVHPANTPITGGVLDTTSNLSAGSVANCLDIETGNKVDSLTDGLINGGTNGGTTFTGRLTRPAAKSCPPPVGGTNPTTLLGHNIVNSTLSCYLRPGYSIGDLNNAGKIAAAGPTGLLNPDIASDPRFFKIPVLYAETNPQNGFYPVVRFRAAFITDETQSSAATPSNGLTASSSKVTSMRAFLFDIDALPDVVNSGGNGSEFDGTLKVVRLIE